MSHGDIGKSPDFVSTSKVRARSGDASRCRHGSNSHAVAVRHSCTKIPLVAGTGSGGQNHSFKTAYQASDLTGSSTWIGQD